MSQAEDGVLMGKWLARDASIPSTVGSLRLGYRGAVRAGAMPGSPMRTLTFLHGMLSQGPTPCKHKHACDFLCRGRHTNRGKRPQFRTRPGLLMLMMTECLL